MWEYGYSLELYHYGVKGMKWGVRKQYEYSDGASRIKSSRTNKLSTGKKIAIGAAVAAAVGAGVTAATPFGRKAISEVATKARISVGKRRAAKAINAYVDKGKFNIKKSKLDTNATLNNRAIRYSVTDRKTGVTAHKMLKVDKYGNDVATTAFSYKDPKTGKAFAIKDTKNKIKKLNPDLAYDTAQIRGGYKQAVAEAKRSKALGTKTFAELQQERNDLYRKAHGHARPTIERSPYGKDWQYGHHYDQPAPGTTKWGKQLGVERQSLQEIDPKTGRTYYKRRPDGNTSYKLERSRYGGKK